MTDARDPTGQSLLQLSSRGTYVLACVGGFWFVAWVLAIKLPSLLFWVTHAHAEDEMTNVWLPPMNASEVTTKQVLSVGPDPPTRAVAKLLLDKNISAVPVVDAAGAVIGMVSENDLLGREVKRREPARVWWLEMLSEGEDLATEFLNYLRATDRPVSDVMVSPVVTVSENTSVQTIAEMLQKATHKEGSCPARWSVSRNCKPRRFDPCTVTSSQRATLIVGSCGLRRARVRAHVGSVSKGADVIRKHDRLLRSSHEDGDARAKRE